MTSREVPKGAGVARIGGRGEVTLKEGDCIVTPGGTAAHEVYDWSDDFELLEITSPAEYETADAPAK